MVNRINADEFNYSIYILINNCYHFQVLTHLNNTVNDMERIRIKYMSDLIFEWSEGVKNREDIIDYCVDYKSAVGKWANSIMSEVHFWEYESLTEGHRCFGEALHRNAREVFDCNRISIFPGCRVLDIGCGCLYKWGNILQDGEYIPMDPLAHFYNHLYKKWKHSNDMRKDTVFGLFEFASLFVDEKMDYVIIDNAIDHCIDPLKAILEALKVLKVEGTLSLYTYEDESINAMGSGLHNWNLALNHSNDLIVYNIDNYVNVSKYLSEYIDFEISEDAIKYSPAVGEHRTFAVNMKKKKEVPEDILGDGTANNLALMISALMRLMASKEYYDDLGKVMEF